MKKKREEEKTEMEKNVADSMSQEHRALPKTTAPTTWSAPGANVRIRKRFFFLSGKMRKSVICLWKI